MGADLVVIRLEPENDFIFDLVKEQKTATWYGAWLGLKRENSTFKWVDGSSLGGNYSAWAPREPSSRKEHCVLMFGPKRVSPGKWNDAFCTLRENRAVVVCQKPSI